VPEPFSEKKIGEEVYQSMLLYRSVLFSIECIQQHTVRYYVFILRHNLKVKSRRRFIYKE
jgi:hypothetical protein